ncbi:hypothetical protein [Homoserinibacter sp. GY 40078]|uniref:hypothetical protein n=1 Tax=Homoserinibacter sp. GY 40078 TaxID=2603275 RepID=UPI0011CCA802|nr:hypothetical protein [Homoserinibacter sp. GY 40078]TXK18443.1 hypothetical protein FVQ89_00300 [Homoserinibacter sp. GY 40078]
MTKINTPEPGTCKCGCGEQVKRDYRPGHDARHVSQLTRAVREGAIEKRVALRLLPTESLREKLTRTLATKVA